MTKVQVDRDNLKQVLDAIQGDDETAKEFRWRGAPTTAFTFRGDDDMVELRYEELEACIEDENEWRADEKYVHRLLLNAVHQFLEDRKGVEDVAAFVEEKLSIELRSFRIAFEVLGLKPGKEPIRFGSSTFGMLDKLAKEAGLVINRERWNRQDSDPAETVAVLVEVEAPEPMKATGPAARLAEDALDLLATSDFRSRLSHGPPWETRIGRRCWVWPEGETETAMGVSNPWMRGYDYEVDQSTVHATGDTRFQAPPDAWTKLPAGDMRDAVERAYVSIGGAMRRAPDAHASVARAWTAVETLYASGRPGDEVGDRAARAVANRFKVAAAAGTGTTDPFELARFYFLRNDVLHDAISWRWSEKDAHGRLWPLYLHIDHLTGFCIKENITTKDNLRTRLMEPTLVAETREWIESWMETTQFRLDHGVLTDVKRRRGEVRQFFEKVLKACGPKSS